MAPDPGAEPGAQADAQAAADQAPADSAAKADKAKRRKRSFWRDLVVIVVAALALTILLKAFVVQVFSIPSGSMENTLLPGDRILVSKIVYKFRPITRGDIVVFGGAGSWDPPAQPPSNWLTGLWADATNLVGIAGPDTDYVKRVIGIPGDHVACCNAEGQVTVNGVPLSESSYVYPGDAPSELRFNITVPPGRLWVMGDNRGDSDDSRYRANAPGGGTIPESAVVGRAFLIVWPLSRISDLPIPNTFEQAGLRAVAAAPPATVAGGAAFAGLVALTWRRRSKHGARREPGADSGARGVVPREDDRGRSVRLCGQTRRAIPVDAPAGGRLRRRGDTLTVISDDGTAWRERTRGARMNGDGFGSPPWDPADPVPELEDTQAIPGLGPIPGPGGPSGRGEAGQRYRRADGSGSTRRPGAGGASGPASDGTGVNGTGANGAGGHGTGDGGRGGGASPKQDPPADAKGGKDGKSGKRRRSFWRELPVLVIVALVLALVIKSFAIQAFFIPSGSMQNTLEINDRVLVNKIVYHLRSIHRGDIIVFDGSGSWDIGTPRPSSNIFSKAVDELEGLVGISQDPSIYIKRVIGLPGDHVACCNAQGQVTVNGVPLSEGSYLYPGNAASTQKFSITVPAGRLWVMGDHRLVSYDSRGHMGDPGGGSIPESAVLGRAFVIIWPPSRWGLLNIPATFEQPRLNASAAAGGNAAAGGSSTALEAALDNGTPIRPATSPLPLALGLIGAVPITWLQRRARRRLKSRRDRRS